MKALKATADVEVDSWVPATASRKKKKGSKSKRGPKRATAEASPEVGFPVEVAPAPEAKKGPTKKPRVSKPKPPKPMAPAHPGATVDSPAQRRQRVTAASAGEGDPLLVKELLSFLWDYAGMDYEMTGLDYHEQKFPGLRLNIYWSRRQVGITHKASKKDIASFTSQTETIITHLYLANLLVHA